MKNRKTSIIALVALLVVALVGSTVAYWSQSSTIENPFDTNTYGSTIVEKFSPQDGEDWQPGVKVNKDVTVKNEGTTDILVRAKLDETWTLKDQTTPYKVVNPKNVYEESQDSETDGLWDKDKTVVIKHFADGMTKWALGSDGWYYYTDNLQSGLTTDKWLDAVELLGDADMGKKVTTFYVSVDDVAGADAVTNWYKLTGSTDKVPQYVIVDTTNKTAAYAEEGASGAVAVTFSKQETKTDTVAHGYSNSNYVLTVTVETVQATQEAVNAVFNKGGNFVKPDACNWTLRNTAAEAHN